MKIGKKFLMFGLFGKFEDWGGFEHFEHLGIDNLTSNGSKIWIVMSILIHLCVKRKKKFKRINK